MGKDDFKRHMEKQINAMKLVCTNPTEEEQFVLANAEMYRQAINIELKIQKKCGNLKLMEVVI